MLQDPPEPLARFAYSAGGPMLAGAIASAIQQSNDVTTGDWSTFYLTTIKDQPEVRLSESTWNQTEELGGWASARIDATWHHHE